MLKSKAERAQVEKLFTRDFLLVATMNLAIFFSFQMLNVGMPVYVAQLGAETQIVGLVTTTMIVATVVVRIFSGPLLDRFGRTGSLISGVAITVCAIISFAIFPVVGIILGIRIIHGIGWGLGSNATSTLAADVIPKKRFAEGMGYFAMTNAVSSALAPAVSLSLLQHSDPTIMLFVSAGISAFAFVVAVIQVALSKRSTNGGSEVVGAEVKDTEPVAETGLENVRGLATFFERRAVVPGILMLLVDVGFGAITTFLALHAKAQGVGNVSVYFFVYAVITLVGRPLIGKFIDRHGYRTPAIFSGICAAGTLVLIAFSTNTFMFTIAGALAGLGFGTAMGTFQTMAVVVVEPWRRGVATSTFMTLFDIGIAGGSFIGGIIAGALGYANMYIAMAAFPLLAGLIAAITLKKGAPEDR